MSLATNLQDFATRAATEDKSIRTLLNGNVADLAALTTAAKANLVAALNEIKAALDALGTPVVIDDAVTAADKAWSSTKIDAEISAALAGVLDSAPAALDTLNELAAALGDDANFAATTSAALGNRVRYDAAQSLTTPQKTQALANIGAMAATDIGDPATNFVTIFEAGLS